MLLFGVAMTKMFLKFGFLCVGMGMVIISCTKLIDYNSELAAEISSSPPPTSEPPAETETAVMAKSSKNMKDNESVCQGKVMCSDGAVIQYWADTFRGNDPDNTLVIHRITHDAATKTYITKNESGEEQEGLTFAAGKPVRLIIEGAGEDNNYDFTAPYFFRNVAWNSITVKPKGTDTRLYVTHLDSIEPAVSLTNEVVLEFVPIAAGTYFAWSSRDVTDSRGREYNSFIDARTGAGDLSEADATNITTWLKGSDGSGQVGAIFSFEVTDEDDLKLRLFQQQDPNRDGALDVNEARNQTYWDDNAASVKTVIIHMSDSDGYQFKQTDASIADAGSVIDEDNKSITFTKDQPYNLRLIDLGSVTIDGESVSGSETEEDHNFNAPMLFRDSVVGPIVHIDQNEKKGAIVYTSSLLGFGDIANDTFVDIQLLPKITNKAHGYCSKGVSSSVWGVPNLQTGHSNGGMNYWIEIEPPPVSP